VWPYSLDQLRDVVLVGVSDFRIHYVASFGFGNVSLRDLLVRILGCFYFECERLVQLVGLARAALLRRVRHSRPADSFCMIALLMLSCLV